MDESRWYGVSTGNGNDGISHMFADYYVKTSEPWDLARVALIDQFKPEGMDWAKDAMEIDGEAEFTIHGVIYDPPDMTGGEWSEHNGAWLLLDVFPVSEEEMRDGTPTYESISEAHSAQALAHIAS
jgi:hypothetical protein